MSDALFYTAWIWCLIGYVVGWSVTRWGLRQDRRDRLHRKQMDRLLHRGVRAARRDERTIEALLAERRN